VKDNLKLTYILKLYYYPSNGLVEWRTGTRWMGLSRSLLYASI